MDKLSQTSCCMCRYYYVGLCRYVNIFALHSSWMGKGRGGGWGMGASRIMSVYHPHLPPCVSDRNRTHQLRIPQRRAEQYWQVLDVANLGTAGGVFGMKLGTLMVRMVHMYFICIASGVSCLCENGYMVIWSGSVLFEHISPKTSQNKPSSSNRVKYLALW